MSKKPMESECVRLTLVLQSLDYIYNSNLLDVKKKIICVTVGQNPVTHSQGTRGHGEMPTFLC